MTLAGGSCPSIAGARAAPCLITSKRIPTREAPVLHWFSGNFRDLERAITLGCWFSIGPAMLASEKGRALAARMPRDRVLTESDGPFAQLDGNPLRPWQVEGALQALGEIWSMSAEEADQKIDENLRRLLATQGSAGSFPQP